MLAPLGTHLGGAVQVVVDVAAVGAAVAAVAVDVAAPAGCMGSHRHCPSHLSPPPTPYPPWALANVGHSLALVGLFAFAEPLMVSSRSSHR